MKNYLILLLWTMTSTYPCLSQTNWELLNPKPTSYTGLEIHFVSPEHGYIITNTELLETTNSGETWIKKQDISASNDMIFQNSTGLIVGDNGYVLKTIDGGNLWEEISTGFTDDLNSINIINESIFILSSSNSILKSVNGGNSWEEFEIPNSYVKKTVFTDSLVGHAACGNGTILKTINGGISWYITESSNIVPSDFLTMHFMSKDIGIASQQHSEIYKTTDAGESWQELDDNVQAIYDFHFLDKNRGFATGESGATYKTIDGGYNWDKIFFQDGYYSYTSMFGIEFLNDSIGYATGNRGRIIKTINGGKVWNDYGNLYEDIQTINFFNDSVAYLRSKNSFYHTNDQGNSWKLSFNLDGNKSATFLNSDTAFVASSGRGKIKIFKTANAGVSWDTTESDFYLRYSPSCFYFLDKNIGFLSSGSGSTAATIRTDDGGATWKEVANTSFRKIEFTNNQLGYASRSGYSDGRLYKTIDSGNSWNICFEKIDDNIEDFYFLNDSVGYLICNNKYLYKTIDAGATWEELNAPYNYYNHIIFYSKNVGFLISEDGEIYKTENGGIEWKILTRGNSINSVDIIGNTLYTASNYGKILRASIETNPIYINLNKADSITSNNAIITGSITSNSGEFSDISLLYGLEGKLNEQLVISEKIVQKNETLAFTVKLPNLVADTTYEFMLQCIADSNTYNSETLEFRTLQKYVISTWEGVRAYASSAHLFGTIISNNGNITDIVFEYGPNKNELSFKTSGTPSVIEEGHNGKIECVINDLSTESEYFYRIRANYGEQVIYGEIYSFTTTPLFNITFNNVFTKPNTAIIRGEVTSYDSEITDIVLEYGEEILNDIVLTNIPKVEAKSNAKIYTELTNLDTNANYLYRLRGIQNNDTIHSRLGVFNLNNEIAMVAYNPIETESDSLVLQAIVNSQFRYLEQIHFEYWDITNSISTMSPESTYLSNYIAENITATINNEYLDQSLFFRLSAVNNDSVIYSNTYQYNPNISTSTRKTLSNNIDISPNPTSQLINISSVESIKSIKIYSGNGKIGHCFNSDNYTNNVSLDIADFKPGIYMISVEFENTQILNKKVIIE